MKLFRNIHIVRKPKLKMPTGEITRDDLPVPSISKKYIMHEWGEQAIKINGKNLATQRRYGFEDGYLYCLRELGLSKTKNKF